MRSFRFLRFGAGIAVLVLSTGCGDEPETGEQPALSSGTGGAPVIGNAGTTSTPTGGTGTAGHGVGTAGAAPLAGSPAAGSGATAGTGVTAGTGTGVTAGSGVGGATAGTSATAGTNAAAGTGGAAAPTAGSSGMTPMGAGMCCADGNCLCHGDPPAAPTGMPGPFKTAMHMMPAGCVYYPMDAEPPFAAVAISDGAGGTGGCGRAQTGLWGPLYASWGIVTMIVTTTGGDSPPQRGMKLSAAIAAFKAENGKAGSPLMGKLSGRYGTSGFSMGGGGTTMAAMRDPELKTNVSIMAWQPANSGIRVPSLFIFGSSDGLAGTMGMSSYRSIMDPTPKMAITVNAGHVGQPSAGMNESGAAGLAFQKVYLEGDERWKPILRMVDADDKKNIE